MSNIKKEIKILPCPFCGGENVTVHTEEYPVANGKPKFGFAFWIKANAMCDNCGSSSAHYINKKKRKAIAEAIKAWNHHPPAKPDSDAVRNAEAYFRSCQHWKELNIVVSGKSGLGHITALIAENKASKEQVAELKKQIPKGKYMTRPDHIADCDCLGCEIFRKDGK